MRKILTALITAGSIAIVSMAAPTSAEAQWRGWRGGWGWGGVGVGLAAGAIVGGAIAANSYYNGGYYNSGYYGYPTSGYPAYGSYAPGYGYAAATYAPGYGYGDTYAPAYGYGYGGTYAAQPTATTVMARAPMSAAGAALTETILG
jgi:hypothetical protein